MAGPSVVRQASNPKSPGAPHSPGVVVSTEGRLLFAPRPVAPLRPDVASDLVSYRKWLDERRHSRLAERPRTPGPGTDPALGITFLMALDRSTSWSALRQAVRGLRAQVSSDWELFVAAIGVSGLRLRLLRWTLERRTTGPRIAVQLYPRETPVPKALNEILARARTPAVGLLDPGDLLEIDTVSLLSDALRHAELVYADEDAVDSAGMHVAPRLKPGWSPELLLAMPYLGRPVVMRRDVVERVGGIADLADGDWEHDLVLRVSEHAARVTHVSEVLCHRTVDPNGNVRSVRERSGVAAVAAAIDRRDETASVEPGAAAGSHRVRRRLLRPVSVSAVIPFRDEPQFLRTVVDSVTATTRSAWLDLELVLVDNGSSDIETLTLVERFEGRDDVLVLRDPRPFNWAALSNAAVDAARGEVLLFLNNDIEALESGWLEALAAQALRNDVGVVGARLLYPSGGALQHAGMAVGLGGAAGHVLGGLASGDPGYMGLATTARECTAVTGACLATRRVVFEALGGFDEGLGLDLNDVDYCLRAIERYWRVLYEPAAELVHHESPSRGTSGSVSDIARFVDRWEPLLLAGDPYLNPNLTRRDGSCALRDADERQWWAQWRATLRPQGTSPQPLSPQ